MLCRKSSEEIYPHLVSGNAQGGEGNKKKGKEE